ncbi:hypothetical protein [Teredinibacter sp. KSP-S5-2]|uniref:hypothetical protein n=1 Tax=Teredinibacter sp. KSP-S5-2 TaxID=3034506 RepID=UPI002934FA84|nr:hypothetical protein [Teredinibacter sp. KSP-S5-2]WNO09063.1 hypothetical protein P5V12_19140 [Teredinibacter sp. KSP-S5-2]
MKYLICLTLIFISSTTFAADSAEMESTSDGMSVGQWVVLGATAAVIAGTYAAEHQTYAEDVRAAAAVVGLASFITVTLIDEHRKSKRKTLKLGLQNAQPALLFSATF